MHPLLEMMDNIIKIILYGSVARNENTDESDIDIQEKSETRKAIEKFVDENPEAVAMLLRNWINEDWG